MVTRSETLVIIPARGGSKGIPRKNVRSFAGHPLIAYSVVAGLQAESVTRVIVSTDDEEIATVARSYGAEIPFLRPAELAQDSTLDLPVFQHALKWLQENEGYSPDVVVQLRPTSPIRPKDCVDRAVQLLSANPYADSVRGVVLAGQNPYKMWHISANGHLQPLLQIDGISEPHNAPRQALPPVYWQTGHIDAIRPKVILEKNSMSGEVILPLILDSRYTVDIDSPADWLVYESVVWQGDLDMVFPGCKPRPFPKQVELLVMDFDGVITDNRVWTDMNGGELVASNRSDSLGLNRLRAQTNIDIFVISKEVNPVVTARCNKMGIPCLQGINDKAGALQALLQERQINPDHVIFVGNDINDLPCFPLVGYSIAVADAWPEVLRQADRVLTRRGGHGAVRELCDFLISHLNNHVIPKGASS
jgi:YrbI family 3-deoxy-D-manno-octulosonate 8-phosphate phosphatase